MARQVTKDEFMNEIYDRGLDVTVTCVGNYPYTCVFKFKNSVEFGREVPGKGWFIND